MATNWNDAQKKAIETRGKSLVVSAAAGSGKTAVLVERIIRMVTDTENPVRLDRLLVVTFTKAAANELRERLRTALEAKLREDPTNKHLLIQKNLLPLADIHNMDQFFGSLVRDNFHKLNITPDFRMLDDAEYTIMKSECLNDVLEDCYGENDEAFDRLLSILGCENNDSTLMKTVQKLDSYANAHLDSDAWLESVSEIYNPQINPVTTVLGDIVVNRVRDICLFAKSYFVRALNAVAGDEELKKYEDLLKNDIALTDDLIKKCKKESWDELYEGIYNCSFGSLPRGKIEIDPDLKEAVSYLRNEAKKIIQKIAKDKLLVALSDDCRKDNEMLDPAVKKLVAITFKYRCALAEKKSEINALCFDDVTHLAVNLLYQNNRYTDLAYELRSKYDEIFIDEYQDTNEAQDTIFRALSSNEENLFIVGDVKQSIYLFRLAMPQIFIRKIDEWSKDEYTKAEYINLDCNYRSRKGVLDGVNYFFERTMSRQVGSVDYDDKQSLKAGFNYPEAVDPCFEISLLETNAMKENEYTEIQYIADRVAQILKSGTVYDKKTEGLRPVQPRDICVLFRKNDSCVELARELKSRNISAFYAASKGFFNATEVKVILSLLAIIDNPCQDIPLLSVLMSPLFGFTSDELSLVRISKNNGTFYNAFINYESEKVTNFKNVYKEYRKLSTVLSVSELIRNIYDTSGYLSVVGALNNGEIRRLNLMMLLDYAQGYEDNSNGGLSGFMRYIDNIKKDDGDFAPAVNVSENANVVQTMTIHKSKGLEFPVVIVGGLTAPMCNSNADGFYTNKNMGIGMKIYEKQNFKHYPTLQYSAMKIVSENDEKSEFMRVLYVAFTRARERLILVCSSNGNSSIEKYIGDAVMLQTKEKLSPYDVQNSSIGSKLIIKAFISHPAFKDVVEKFGYKQNTDAAADFSMKVNYIDNKIEADCEDEEEEAEFGIDEEMLSEIREKTAFTYPYAALSDKALKYSASDFNKIENRDEYFMADVPAFAQNGGVSSAARGTAMHRFMEVCSFENAKNDIENELERLTESGVITAEQSKLISVSKIKPFFDSKIYSRIEASPRVLREQKFTVYVPLSLTEENCPEEFKNEKVIVQGVIDCAFFENNKIVVVDYKSDRVRNVDELRERYHKQLEIYKLACEQAFNCEVSDMILYSFELSQEKNIEIN